MLHECSAIHWHLGNEVVRNITIYDLFLAVFDALFTAKRFS